MRGLLVWFDSLESSIKKDPGCCGRLVKAARKCGSGIVLLDAFCFLLYVAYVVYCRNILVQEVHFLSNSKKGSDAAQPQNKKVRFFMIPESQ